MSLVASKIAQQAARDVLKKFPYKQGHSTDVKKVAAALGIDIIQGEITTPNRKNISGLIKMNGKDGRPVIAINASESEERKRFTIAHEIGHYILHSNELVHVDSDEVAAFRDSLSSTATSLKEIQANQFAAELLMPSAEVREVVKKHFPEKEITEIIGDISVKYNVSTLAATIKISALLSSTM